MLLFIFFWHLSGLNFQKNIGFIEVRSRQMVLISFCVQDFAAILGYLLEVFDFNRKSYGKLAVKINGFARISVNKFTIGFPIEIEDIH